MAAESADQIQVAGTEIVSPLADTVGFVQRQITDADILIGTFQGIQNMTLLQLFRRKIYQFVITQFQMPETGLPLPERNIAVDKARQMIQTVPSADSLLVLILHQRFEGRDNNGNPGQEHCRQDKTLAFAAACGCYAENAAACQHRCQNAMLKRMHRLEPEKPIGNVVNSLLNPSAIRRKKHLPVLKTPANGCDLGFFRGKVFPDAPFFTVPSGDYVFDTYLFPMNQRRNLNPWCLFYEKLPHIRMPRAQFDKFSIRFFFFNIIRIIHHRQIALI